MDKKLITNPFIVYGLTWTGVLLVYSLGWSELFPSLSAGLLLFFYITIAISVFLGFYFHNKSMFQYSMVGHIKLHSIRNKLFVLYFLIVVELIQARTIPIFAYLSGNRDFDYTKFGLPYVHVVIVNFLSFLFVYSFHCYRSTQDKRARRSLKIYLFLSLLPALLFFNRGMIIACVFGATIIYIMSVKNGLMVLLRIGLFAMGGLFFFGALGNLRTDTQQVKNIILTLGKATPEFRESHVPDEMFWGYIYIASPLSNLQNTVNQYANSKLSSKDVLDYILSEWTMQVFSKRIDEMFPSDKKEASLIVDYFNVSTVYAGSYAYLGWFGMIGTFCFMVLFVLVTILLVPRGSPYFISTIAIINTVILLNMFGNMFVFMGVIPQLAFPIFMTLFGGQSSRSALASSQPS